eukprot:scaffold19250_cov21-Cyclotella_meneghiniana.AAC.2
MRDHNESGNDGGPTVGPPSVQPANSLGNRITMGIGFPPVMPQKEVIKAMREKQRSNEDSNSNSDRSESPNFNFQDEIYLQSENTLNHDLSQSSKDSMFNWPINIAMRNNNMNLKEFIEQFPSIPCMYAGYPVMKNTARIMSSRVGIVA